MKISLHIHSEHSKDSKQTISSIISQCLSLGYHAIAITDHNTVAGSVEASKLQPENLDIIIGAEFSTDKGHILALFIDEQIERTCKKNGKLFDFDDLILKVREQGGLLFLAHPLQSKATVDHSFISKLDGYEIINARVHSSHREEKANKLNKILKENYPDKIVIGGSDAHTKSEVKSVYMITENDPDLKKAFSKIQDIYFKKSSMTLIRFNNLINNKNMKFKYYIRQLVLMLYGLIYDLINKIKGSRYEIIRIRKKS